jgi:hypothetical protein
MRALFIIQRLREPSTWAAISAMGLLFGLPPGTVDAVGMLLGGIAGIAAIVLPESKA